MRSKYYFALAFGFDMHLCSFCSSLTESSFTIVFMWHFIFISHFIFATFADSHYNQQWLMKRTNDKVPDLNFSPPPSPKESNGSTLGHMNLDPKVHQAPSLAQGQHGLTSVSYLSAFGF